MNAIKLPIYIPKGAVRKKMDSLASHFAQYFTKNPKQFCTVTYYKRISPVNPVCSIKTWVKLSHMLCIKEILKITNRL